MRVAIFGRRFSEQSEPFVQQFFDLLNFYGTHYSIYGEFKSFLDARKLNTYDSSTFNTSFELSSGGIDVLLSLGGDGTLLDTVTLVRDSGLPVLGINLGRLGFLASINKTELASALNSLHEGNYSIDARQMITLESVPALFTGVSYCLNDVTIHKQDSAQMIIIHAYLDGEFLNSYWADGLIIATPTGSTAYSLSCGGPIVLPGCSNFIINPIAPHNLNVRPLIINDNHVLRFEVEGRADQFLVTLDSRTEVCDGTVSLTLRRSIFAFNLLRLNSENYLNTLRKKLMWGLDSRN